LKHIKTYNESIRHLLKPKSEEDILKSVERLSDKNKFILSLEHDIDWLFDELINNEKLTNNDYLEGLHYCAKRENLNMIDKIFNIKGFYEMINKDEVEKLIYKSSKNNFVVINHLINNQYIKNFLTEDEFKKIKILCGSIHLINR